MSTTLPVRTADAPLSFAADVWWQPDSFEQAQRVARLFASSMLVPEHLRGKIADCTIAIVMARQLNENPLLVLQNIHVINGKAGWSSQYMIARANASGLLAEPIDWESSGKGKDLEVTAYTTLLATGRRIQATASMAMAEAEGWTRNAKYRSMPEHMLRWRSASMLIRLYLPQVMMGLRTVEEVVDGDSVGARAEWTSERTADPVIAEAADRLLQREAPPVVERVPEPDPLPRETTDERQRRIVPEPEPEPEPDGGPTKADCKVLEDRISEIDPDAVSRIRARSRSHPETGQSVTSWRGRAPAVAAYHDDLADALHELRTRGDDPDADTGRIPF